MSRILAVSYGAGHINMVIPVVQELQSRGHNISLLALTTAHGPAARAGLNPLGFRDVLRSSDCLAQEWGHRLAAGNASHPDVHPKETPAYLGLNYAELIESNGEEGARRLFAEHGRQAFLPLASLRRVFEATKPDLVVATSSPRSERASILIAGEMGIPSLVLCDFMPQSELEWLKSPAYGTRLCVMSQGVKARLVESGRLPGQVAVTGNPAFDSAFDLDAPTLGTAWRRRHGYSESDRVALFASQPDREPNRGARAAAELSVAAAKAGWKLAVRPHPNEEFDNSLMPPDTAISGPSESVWEALCGCDGCIVISSTVGIQALLLGKPMSVYDTPVNADPAPYPAMGLGGVGRLPAEVFESLGGQSPGQDFGMPRARATQTVADEAEGLLR